MSDVTLQEFNEHIKAIPSRIAGIEAVNMAAGQVFVKDVHGFFNTETDPDGRRWFPLAESTKRRKGGGKILEDTGDMKRSVSFTANATRIVVGAMQDYSTYHQHGTADSSGKMGRMPRRSFIGFKKESINKWLAAVSDWVLTGKKAARLG